MFSLIRPEVAGGWWAVGRTKNRCCFGMRQSAFKYQKMKKEQIFFRRSTSVVARRVWGAVVGGIVRVYSAPHGGSRRGIHIRYCFAPSLF